NALSAIEARFKNDRSSLEHRRNQPECQTINMEHGQRRQNALLAPPRVFPDRDLHRIAEQIAVRQLCKFHRSSCAARRLQNGDIVWMRTKGTRTRGHLIHQFDEDNEFSCMFAISTLPNLKLIAKPAQDSLISLQCDPDPMFN